jgi:hypothetical protein
MYWYASNCVPCMMAMEGGRYTALRAAYDTGDDQ